MSKVIRPAMPIVTRCYKENWRNIFVLAIKTYVSVYLLCLLVSILSDTLLGTEFITRMNSYSKSSYNLFSFQSFEIPSITQLQPGYFETILTFILGLVKSWLTAPLFTSISRTVILGEKFEPIFWKRLTEVRCLQVTFLLWFIGFVLLSNTLIKVDFLSDSSWGSLCSSLYSFLTFYVVFRALYLLPAFAIGNPPSTLGRGWTITRQKVWALIKLTIVIFLPSFFMIAVVTFILRMAGISLNDMAQIIIYGHLINVGFCIVFIPLYIAGLASIYQLSHEG